MTALELVDWNRVECWLFKYLNDNSHPVFKWQGKVDLCSTNNTSLYIKYTVKVKNVEGERVICEGIYPFYPTERLVEVAGNILDMVEDKCGSVLKLNQERDDALGDKAK